MQRNVPGLRKVGSIAPVGMKTRKQLCPERGKASLVARRVHPLRWKHLLVELV